MTRDDHLEQARRAEETLAMRQLAAEYESIAPGAKSLAEQFITAGQESRQHELRERILEMTRATHTPTRTADISETDLQFAGGSYGELARVEERYAGPRLNPKIERGYYQLGQFAKAKVGDEFDLRCT